MCDQYMSLHSSGRQANLSLERRPAAAAAEAEVEQASAQSSQSKRFFKASRVHLTLHEALKALLCVCRRKLKQDQR